MVRHTSDVDTIKKAVIATHLTTPLAKLLTECSKKAHGMLPKKEMPQRPYIFFGHPYNTLPGFPYDGGDWEDILVVRPADNQKGDVDRTEKNGRHLCEAVSLVVCESKGKHGGEQLVSDASQLLKARPDIVGTYALWASSDEYQIIWFDASGVVMSEVIPWEDLTPLKQYIWSLYVPPESHTLFDKSITRQPDGEDMWSIRISTGEVYTNLTRAFIGSSYGRRTNVFTSFGTHANFVVIKDSFPDSLHYGREVRALEIIHENGVFPGVVRLLRSEHDPVSRIDTVPIHEAHSSRTERSKARFVMGSTGESILMAKSVLDILKAIFDILETHRALVRSCNILHRDISIYNILIYPKHNEETLKDKKLIENPPVFIRQILEGGKDDLEIDKSSAILIDFDNCARTYVENGDNRHLKERIGTPMFIARAVASEAIRTEAERMPYHPMPELGPGTKARMLYDAAYGSEEYERFCENGQTIHGVNHLQAHPKLVLCGDEEGDEEDKTAEPSSPVFHHKPEHDVESVFWVLLYTLIQANPSNPSKEPDQESLSAYWQILDLFHQHRIRQHSTVDRRDSILLLTLASFKKILHPDLSPLSYMLRDMALQITPDYSHLPEAPKPEHLHEVMRRLLLHRIVKLEKNPIPLQPGTPRPGPPSAIKEETVTQDGGISRKRSRKGTDSVMRNNGSKRQKSH